jgi:hypothetical protein
VKLRIFTIALASLVLASLCGAAFAQRTRTRKHNITAVDRWYVLVSPDGDFTLSFPKKPNREADGQGPRTPIKSYGLYTENQMRFSINFQSLAEGPNWSLANEWNDRYEKAQLIKDRENNRRVVHTQLIDKHTFEAEVWDAGTDTGESINYLRRTIVRRARLYTLLCGSEIYGRKVDKGTCRRFFNSMRFLDPTPTDLSKSQR